MVNFKAGGHQGQRARAQAAQNTDGAGSSVSKTEKLALRPWSNDDPLRREVVNPGGIALQVVAREKVLDESNAFLKAGLVHPATLAHLEQAAGGGARQLFSRPGGDFVLAALAHERANEGEVLLGEAQRLSLHVCEGEAYEWVPHEWVPHGAVAAPLAELCVEVALLEPRPPEAPPLPVAWQRLRKPSRAGCRRVCPLAVHAACRKMRAPPPRLACGSAW